jgi:hypothetical protein
MKPTSVQFADFHDSSKFHCAIQYIKHNFQHTVGEGQNRPQAILEIPLHTCGTAKEQSV